MIKFYTHVIKRFIDIINLQFVISRTVFKLVSDLIIAIIIAFEVIQYFRRENGFTILWERRYSWFKCSRCVFSLLREYWKCHFSSGIFHTA